MSNRRHALAIREEDFPRKGQALERMLLLAPSDTRPQMLLSMGRDRAVPPASRRPLSEVLV